MKKILSDLSIFKKTVGFVSDLLMIFGTGCSLYYLINNYFKPEFYSYIQKKKSKKLIQSNPRFKNIDLNVYELEIIKSLTVPEEIETGFSDIGGLETLIDEIKQNVIFPLMNPDIISKLSKLIQLPKGILLYGPPGCGKTMVAKAIAKCSGACFFLIRMSMILSKWFGESNKIVDAIFSLANKMEPSIIFIDEIDCFFRSRSLNDHELNSMMKAEFMTLWDGLQSNGRIFVLGATNRKNDIDEAFLRRFSKTYFIDKPNPIQRMIILEKILNNSGVDTSDFDFRYIISKTNGWNSSDLKSLCSKAAFSSIRSCINQSEYNMEHLNVQIPKLTSDDLVTALKNSIF